MTTLEKFEEFYRSATPEQLQRLDDILTGATIGKIDSKQETTSEKEEKE